MNPDVQTALTLLLVAIIGGATTKLIPAIFEWVQALLKAESSRHQNDATHDSKEEALDLETRELTNKLALQAFDIQARLERLKGEYEEQGKLVKLQAANIETLGRELTNCRDVQVLEYKRQVDLLLGQLEEFGRVESGLRQEIVNQQKTIAKLKVDIQILETTK